MLAGRGTWRFLGGLRTLDSFAVTFESPASDAAALAGVDAALREFFVKHGCAVSRLTELTLRGDVFGVGDVMTRMLKTAGVLRALCVDFHVPEGAPFLDAAPASLHTLSVGRISQRICPMLVRRIAQLPQLRHLELDCDTHSAVDTESLLEMLEENGCHLRTLKYKGHIDEDDERISVQSGHGLVHWDLSDAIWCRRLSSGTDSMQFFE
mmetsp:Transcript_34498/g.106562  ORF Transcript_34498/g.106562 Transcript_34498/m.106562 type:complete len:209 (-) Transcript_34498:87-713(-)